MSGLEGVARGWKRMGVAKSKAQTKLCPFGAAKAKVL